MKLHYKPHIDSLRGIAVLFVIFYHLEISSYFSGGYVGVDIFFVISGFLITKIIVEKINDNTFTFSEFYLRRFRRIFPTFIFTVITTFIISVVIFPPNYIERISGSVIHSIMSISNIYFWQESNYFDTSKNLKPLLHTWSLSIEEQFYLFLPVILFILNKKLKLNFNKILMILFIIALVSLISTLYYKDISYSDNQFLEKDYSTIFYLIPFRMYEFIIGGSMVWAQKYKSNNTLINELFTLIGLIMVFYSVIFFTDSTLFPSYNALIPCAGAAMLIYFGEKSILGRIFNNIFFVKIGIISYSLYLSHWPIYVFYRYLTSNQLSQYDKLMVIVLSTLTSIFMYKFIEQRYRYQTNKPCENSLFLLNFSLVSLFLVSIAAHAWANKGWSEGKQINTEGRLTKKEWKNYTANDQLVISNTSFHDYVWQRHLELEKPFYDHQKNNILIIGDSMAGDFVNILMESNKERKEHEISREIRTIPIRKGCSPLITLKPKSVWKENDYCIKQHQMLKKNISLRHADIVILAANWGEWAVGYLPQTIIEIKKYNNAKIIILGKKTTVQSGLDLYSKGVKTVKIDDETLLINKRISKIQGDFLQINLTDFFCPADECSVYDSTDNFIYLYDRLHLTPQGAKKIREYMYTRKDIRILLTSGF